MKSRTSVKPVFTAPMKYAVMSAFVLIVLSSQAFAVLRPPFPAKPVAPANSDLIVIGDEFVLRSAKAHYRTPLKQQVSADKDMRVSDRGYNYSHFSA